MLEDLGKAPPVDLVDYCVNAVQYTEDAIFYKRNFWQANWNEYLGHIDFSDKAEWQSKGHLPKFKQAVRVAKNTLKSAMIKSDNFFQITGPTPETKAVAPKVTKAVKDVLDQSRFKQKQFPNGVFRALLESLMIYKTWVEPIGDNQKISTDQTFKFPVQTVSAFDLFIDPTMRRKFIIHRMKKDLSDYKRLCERGVYRSETLAEIAQTDYENYEDDVRQKVRQDQQDAPKPPWRKEVELLEFWGDVDDEFGNTVHRNCTFTIVDRKWVARNPIENPFDHKKPPFVFGPIFEIDGTEYPETFGDQVLGICAMIDESYNLAIDAASAEAISAFVLNIDYLHNPGDYKSGIYPGKVVKVKGVPPGTEILKEFQLGHLTQENLLLMSALDREFQNGTGINEFISGLMSSGDKTATEVKQKSIQSIGFLQSLAEDTQDNVLTPLVYMVYRNMLQYNPELFGTEFNQLPIEDVNLLFEVKGMSQILQQMEEFAKITQWVGMFAKTPMMQFIDWKNIATMGAVMMGQRPDDLILAQPMPMPPQTQPPQGQGAMQ